MLTSIFVTFYAWVASAMNMDDVKIGDISSLRLGSGMEVSCPVIAKTSHFHFPCCLVVVSSDG